MFFYSYDHASDYKKIEGLITSEYGALLNRINQGHPEGIYFFDEDDMTIGIVWIDENVLEWLSIIPEYRNERKIEGLFDFCVQKTKQLNYSSMKINKDINCLSTIINDYGEQYNDSYVQINF